MVLLVLLLLEHLSIQDNQWILEGPRSRGLLEGQEVRGVPQQAGLVGEVEVVDNTSLRLKKLRKRHMHQYHNVIYLLL